MIGLVWLAVGLVCVPFVVALVILGTRAIRNDRARREALRISSIWLRDRKRTDGRWPEADDIHLLETAETMRKFLQGES